MGEYLSKPDKTKHSNEGENNWVSHRKAFEIPTKHTEYPKIQLDRQLGL